MSLLKVAGTTAASGTLYVDDVFSTWLYTGNGSTQTITNGIDLAGKGGLVWIKNRSAVQGNFLVDTLRGGDVNIKSNTTAGNDTGSGQGAQSFTSTGFVAGGFSTNDYASWTFRKAAKFFDVVTYTGDGSSHHSIPHSLGSVPGMIIVKRTDTTSNWAVYHTELGIGTIYLNSTAAYFVDTTIWDGTPSATTFSVNTNSIVNASGGTYVAYLFAHDTSSTGIIQCGYATAGTDVNLGWEPQYVMMRNPSALANWLIVDSMRGMPVGSAAKGLLANTSDAESNWGGYVVPNATGFTIGTDGIYMAIRMPNKPPTTGTQVFSPLIGNNAQGTQNTTDFTVDLQWAKYRSGVSGTYDADRLRGVSTTSTTGGQHLITSSTAAEGSTNATQFWNNTGFQTSSGWASTSMAYWNFQRAPGFFDEVCYTGTGVATTQAHNLGVVPELMIVKSRSGAVGWAVYCSMNGGNETGVLNGTDAFIHLTAFWNNSTPTATTFTVATNNWVNGSGSTYVAYLFATLAGISKVGSYTGNGTGQAIACGFSAGARFVLIKRTDSTGDWYTFDSARGLTVGSSPYLLLNSTAAEVTGNNGVYQSTGGFTLGATAITTTNIATATYIFLAVS